MKKALILTVGTGTRPETDIVKPLVKTVRNSSPDYVGFLVSAESRKYADEIVKQVDLNEDAFKIVQLSQPDKIDQVFRAGNAMIRDIMARGFSCRDIAVDYTSGTKAMTGGLVLSAVANSCEELKYITGQRRNGVVMDGTEEFLTMSPAAILAHREIQVAQLLICNYRFDAALDLLHGLNLALLDEYDSSLAQNLEHLACAYNYWDKFDHARFLGEYSQVAWGQKELEAFRSSDETRQRVTGMMKALKKDDLSEDMLADMFCNSYRRVEEGKFDDALARLYRLIEMLAQWALASCGLSNSDVDVEKVPNIMKLDLEGHRDPNDGKIKIALVKSYQLLEALGESLGKDFMADGRIRALLNSRNYSILAHGNKPIAEKECRALLDATKRLLETHVPDFQARASELRFPWTIGPKE